MCCFEIFNGWWVRALYSHHPKNDPSAILTWRSTSCLDIWFPFRRHQHMQHSVEQHRCNFWINIQPLMASQEVNSLIPVSEKQSRQQTELSAAARHRAGCSTVVPPPAATRFLSARLLQLSGGRLTLQRDPCANICNQRLLIVPDDLHFGRRSFWSNYFLRSLVSFYQTCEPPRRIVPACVPVSKLKRDKMSSDLSQSDSLPLWFII